MPDIISKFTRKSPSWLNILFYFSVAALLITVLLLFSLIRFAKSADRTLQDLENTIAKDKPEQEILEKEVFGSQEKIDDFSKLLTIHYIPLNFFVLLENLCHPRVRLTEISLNLKEARAGFSGESASFQALEQQLVIFRHAKEVRSVQLSNISLNKLGGATFAISLALDPEIFK